MSWYTEEGEERGRPYIPKFAKEFRLHADTDYVWISKIYDVISLSKYDMEVAKWEMREAGITVDDLSQMVDDGLIDIDIYNDKIILKEKIYEYIKPEILRGNWIYLEPGTRRRFVNRKTMPNMKDGRKARATLHNMIVNYYRSRGKDFYLMSSLYLPSMVIDYFKTAMPYVRIVDTVETCPIGLNKEECESYWRQIGGDDMFAYKDFTINGQYIWREKTVEVPREKTVEVPIRLFLSRYYRGVYFDVNPRYVRDYEVKYFDIFEILKGDDVLPVIREAPYLRNWENVKMGGVGYKETMRIGQRRTSDPPSKTMRFMKKYGFLPVFNRKCEPLIS